MHQELLPLREPDPEPRAKTVTIEERFAEWMEGQGAEVYRHFTDIAERLRGAGQRRYSSKAIVEVCRYFRTIQGRDKDGWKINNSYTALLARRLIAERTEYSDWFELRKLRDER